MQTSNDLGGTRPSAVPPGDDGRSGVAQVVAGAYGGQGGGGYDNKKPQHTRKRIHAIAWICVAVAFFCVVDLVCSFLFSPYGTYTETRWWLYRQQKNENIDTIVMGPSFAMLDVDPNVIDSYLGTSSWTLASQAQSLDASYWGIETAIRDHHISQAILVTGYSTLCTQPYYSTSLTYMQHRMRGESLSQALCDGLEFVGDDNFNTLSRSMSFLCPWAVSHVDYNLGSIRKNLSFRIRYATPLEATEADDAEWQYQGKGFAGYDRHADFTTVDTLAHDAPASQELRDDNLTSLARVCELCRDQGVQLYVVVAPQPFFETLSRDNYAQNMERVKDLCTERGAIYCDFNLARAGTYTIDNDRFMDREHLNLNGAKDFSAALADEISKVDVGYDISQDFYSYDHFDEYLASIDVISAIRSEVSVQDGHVLIKGSAYKGSNVEVEWRFEVQDPATGEWRVVQDYSSTNSCEIATDGNGTLVVRECARKVGSAEDYQCYVIDRVDYY